MPLNELWTGPQRAGDDVRISARGDNYGATLTGAMNGFFAEQVMRGNGYSFSSALAGVALIAATTTNNKMVIWNPPDSGRVLLLQFVKYGRTAVGTPLEGSVVYNRAQDVRSFGATGNDIVSGTGAAAVNLRSDLPDNSKMKFFPAASVLTTAPSLWAAAGVAQTADAGATTVSGPRVDRVIDELWGVLQVWPSTLFSIGAAVSIATTYTISVFALSLPLPAQAA